MSTAITFHATIKNEGTNGVLKWKKNNTDAGVNDNAYFTSGNFHDGDVVTCEYSCKTSCGVNTTVASNSITVHILNDITPSISIANYDSLICEGELTVFKATAFYGNEVPQYQWSVNGDPVGTNSPVFSTSTLTNGARIECKLTISTPSCPGESKSSNSQLTIYVYPMIHPAIKITPDKAQICRGESVTFTATANGGAYPAFAWKVNGIPTGPDAPSLTTSTLRDGDTVSCTVTIDQDSRCHTTTSAPSNEVVMHVTDYADPTLKIVSPTTDICAGTEVTFTAIPQNALENTFYQWKINGQNSDNHLLTFKYDNFSNGDKVSCALTTQIPGCSVAASAMSNIVTMTVKEIPAITFTPPEISILSGEFAQLKASVLSNVISTVWTPGALLLTPVSLTTSTVPLIQDTVFNLTVVDANGCTGSKNLPVKVLHKLYMPSAFTPNKDGKNDVFRIPPGASLKLKEFSVADRWGNIVFRTTNISEGWNGTCKSENLNTGTYVYLIKGIFYGKDVTMKGTVILLR